MKVKLLQTTPNPEETLVYIARVSTSKSEEEKRKNPEKLIYYLIENKHWSPFEHSFMTIEVETSRAIAHQILRHRSMFFQEFSMRYANIDVHGENWYESVEFRKQAKSNRQSSEKKINPEIEIRIPTLFNLSGDANTMLELLFKINKQFYDKLIENGVARETARFVLPLATKTKLYITGNIRSWIHFLDIRDDTNAQKEIKNIAKEIKKVFIRNYPITAKALKYQ